MSTKNFYDFLSDLLSSEQKPLALPALRQDSLIFAGLQTPGHVENLITARDYLQTHFAPGNFALAAISPDRTSDPTAQLPAQVLEGMMTGFESFKQNGVAADSLDTALDIATALIEKRRIATHWKAVLNEVFRSRNGKSDAEMTACWSTPLAIASHLDAHSDELLDALSQPDAPVAYLMIYVHCVLTQPVDLGAKVRSFASAIANQSEQRQLSILNLLRSQADEQLASKTAGVVLDSTRPASPSVAEIAEIWARPAEALNQVMRNQNLGIMAQLAHEDEAAFRYIQAAEKTLAAVQTGLNLQKVAVLSRLDRKDEVSSVVAEINRDHPQNADVTAELTMALEPEAPTDLSAEFQKPEAPLAGFVQAKSIEAAGNYPLAKEAAANAFNVLIAQPEVMSMTRHPRFAHNFSLTSLFDTLTHYDLNNEATIIARKILADNPANLSVIEKSAPLFFQAGDYTQAVDLYRTLEVLDPASIKVKRAKALCLEALGEDEQAFHAWNAFVPASEESTEEDLLHLARTANRVGNVHAAIQAAAAIPESSANYGKALVVLGKSYRKLGDAAQAMQYLAKAIETEVDEPEPWLALADLYAKNNEFERAADTLRAAKSVFPESKEILFVLAKRLLDKESPSEALTVLSELTSKAPEYMPGQILTVKTMKSLNHEGTDEKIEELARIFPDSPEVNFLLGQRYLQSGLRIEARDALSQAVATQDPDPEWLVVYADALAGEEYRSVEPRKALSAANATLARQALDGSGLIETDPLAASISAEIHLSDENPSEAFRVLSTVQSKQTSPDSEWYWRLQANVARSAVLLGKFDIALASVQEAIGQQPQLAGLRQILAEVYKASGDSLAAVEAANQVLVIAPNVVENVLWFAQFLTGLDHHAEAEKELQKAIAARPAEIKYRLALAELLAKSGRNSELAATLGTPQAVLQANPSEADLVKAAEIYWSNGDVQSALTLLEKRAADFPASLNAQIDLAGALAQTGASARSVEILSAIPAGGSDPSAALINAEVHYQNSDFTAASAALEALGGSQIKIDPALASIFLPGTWTAVLNQKHPVNFMSARVSFAKADYQQTVDVCKQWLSDESDSATALFYSNQAKRALGVEPPAHKLDRLEAAPAWVLCAWAQDNLDSGSTDRSLGLIERAADSGAPADWIAALRVQAAVARGELIEAQVNEGDSNLLQPEISTWVKAEDIARITSLVHSQLALKHWDAALDLAEALKASNPTNHHTAALHLQAMVTAIETSHYQQGQQIKAHSVSSSRLDVIEKELAAIVVADEAAPSKVLSRWIARGKLALQPSQENLRSLALISPRPDDIVAMMHALRAIDDCQTALQVARKFEHDPAVLNMLAICQGASDPKPALSTLERSLQIAEGQPEAWVAKSILEEKLGEKEAAIQSMENALSYWPEEAAWHIRAAQLWQSAGDPKKAVEHLRTASDFEKDSAEIQYQIGTSYASLGRTVEAIQVLEQASSKETNRSDILEALADAYYHAGNHERAIKTADRASLANPFSVKPILLTGEIELEKGEIARALEQARIAISKNEKSAEAITFLAKVLLKKGDKTQALAALEKAATSEDATLDLMLKHARLVREIKGSSNSKAIFEGLVKKYPQNIELLKLLAESQLDCGEKVAAEETARHSLRLEAEQPEIHEFLGKLKFAEGNLDQAVYHFSQQISLDAESVSGYLELAKVYQKRRDFHKALETLQQGIQSAPADARAYIASANMLREARDYSSAESMLRKAAAINPHDINIKRQLGAVIALNLVHKSQQASSQL